MSALATASAVLHGAVLTWADGASLATAGGTLVLAVATFASVRSANRSARIAELALQEQRRPLLVQSRADDPEQKIMFGDERWQRVGGGGAAVEHADGNIYLSPSLRNLGAGIGVLLGWRAYGGRRGPHEGPPAEEELRRQLRDLYIPAGDLGLWQGALRDAEDTTHQEIAAAIAERKPISIELLYSDQVGGQRTMSRFTLTPASTERWIASVTRHWHLESAGPRG